MSSVKIFKGRKYHACPTVVTMPTRDAEGKLMPYVKEGEENYVVFGRLVSKFFPTPANAVKTEYCWNKGTPEEKPAYAILVPGAGYSLTNMMYGADDFMYLALDGKVYRAAKPAKVAA